MANQKGKNWCFTLNNPTTAHRAYFRELLLWGAPGIVYVVFQEEQVVRQGPERDPQVDTGRNGLDHGGGLRGPVHFQGYMEMEDRKRRQWMSRHVCREAHWEKRRGTQQQAIVYAEKQQSRVRNGLRGEWYKFV